MESKLDEIYDEFAKTYDDNRGLFDLSDLFAGFYQRIQVKPGQLLDLGCGTGEAFSKYFIDKGWQVTGVDFSKQMLALANRYVPEMTTMHADIMQVDFEDNQFDAIVAIYSLFHLPKERHSELFEKMHRWLRADGKAFFTYATKQYTGGDEYDGYINFLGKELYYSHKTPEQLYADLQAAGFVVEDKQYKEIGGETFLWVTVSK